MTALIIIVIALALLAGFITTRPADFRVTRSITVAAPVSAVFPHVNELRKWKAWSPWAKLDPNAKESFDGPAAGTGAVMRWSGNSKVGEGSMTITESRLDEFIRFGLDFLRPMKSTSTAEFTFGPDGGSKTAVTWTMYGKNNFMAKAIGLIMNCEKMVGGQFEKGLADLKSLAELSPGQKEEKKHGAESRQGGRAAR